LSRNKPQGLRVAVKFPPIKCDLSLCPVREGKKCLQINNDNDEPPGSNSVMVTRQAV